MTAPAAYANDLEEGVKEVLWQGRPLKIEPLPWYLDYIQAAERAGVPPWEMFDCWTPREFWKDVLLIVSGAEAAAQKTRKERSAALAYADSMQG